VSAINLDQVLLPTALLLSFHFSSFSLSAKIYGIPFCSYEHVIYNKMNAMRKVDILQNFRAEIYYDTDHLMLSPVA
jgi:hypothetical protein